MKTTGQWLYEFRVEDGHPNPTAGDNPPVRMGDGRIRKIQADVLKTARKIVSRNLDARSARSTLRELTDLLNQKVKA